MEEQIENDVTYEEWLKASRFQKFRYKYSLFVLIGCWICFILLIIFVVIYSRELSSNPISYMMNKFDLNSCRCFSGSETYLINETSITITKNPYLILP